MNKSKIIILAVLASQMLFSCSDREKGKLDNRVKDYWTARIKGDYKLAYQFLSPGWKQHETETAYINRMNSARVKWLDFELKEKKCKKSDICEVKVKIKYEYEFVGSGAGKITVDPEINENWIMKNNIWYNVPKK